MFKYTIMMMASLFVLTAGAKNHSAKALQYVPNGKIVEEKSDELKVQTATGSVIELDFDSSGALEEASGNVVDSDTMVPPQGLISLATAAESARKAGKNLSGKWKLNKSVLTDWRYEFDGFENGKEMEYTVDARTGKYLTAKAD